ncbi:hydroxycarboxylic acid receptor 2-like [Hyperolius riggenbachi]|uniref:hydroxycarboxylic acid receptor 2-like n=1 Tax=Hyperolius riggenbachi TaxID=752182 RepID=UPI0035A30CEB
MIMDGFYPSHNQSNCTCCFFEDTLLSYVIPPILIIIFLLGSLFNGIALWAFCFHIKEWKSSTVYLFNLSVADFLLIICLPFRTDYYLKQKTWLYGDVPCRVMLFMCAVNRAGSIFFLTIIGLDRYFKVVYPHHKINFMSIKAAIITTCAVWLTAISVTAFILTKNHTGGNKSRKAFCDSFLVCPVASWWHDVLFIMEFFLPMFIVLFCSYSIIWRLRQRNLDKDTKIKKAVKCITLVGVVFCICFLPSVSTRIEIIRLSASPEGCNCSLYRTVETAFFITLCFTYMNSVCNPLVYYFSSPSMRTFYLQVLVKLKIYPTTCPKLSIPK